MDSFGTKKGAVRNQVPAPGSRWVPLGPAGSCLRLLLLVSVRSWKMRSRGFRRAPGSSGRSRKVRLRPTGGGRNTLMQQWEVYRCELSQSQSSPPGLVGHQDGTTGQALSAREANQEKGRRSGIQSSPPS